MTPYTTHLHLALSQNNLSYADHVLQQFVAYLTLIQTWNKIYNLTSINDPQEMVYLHLIDSLLIAPYLSGNHLIDIGTGAGLPGIPLALINPNQQWTLLDKNGKKTRFLTQVKAELGLANVTIIKSRAEDFKPQEKFNTIVTRAYGTLRLFYESTAHLLATNGILLAMKGKFPQQEITECAANFQCTSIKLPMNGFQVERHIIIGSQR